MSFRHRFIALAIPTAVLATLNPGAVAQELGSLVIQVIDGDGIGVADAEVRIVDLGRRALPEEPLADGWYAFGEMPPGSYLVEAVSLRSGRGVERIEVPAGRTVRVVLELDPLFQLDELVVSAGPESARRSETYQPNSSMSGMDLVRDVESSLGETLAGEPGVNSTYNGPGSSRPLIRGLGGDRIRVLEAGVGSGDVSNQGPDHAVGIEPLAAERIEVVRGPATLMYGSAAVGGVVNVLDNRIPRDLPSKRLTGWVTALAGTVAEERTGGFELNGGGGSFAWHLSGLRRETDDYSIPGFAEHQHEEDDPAQGEEPDHGEEAFGVLPNSAVATTRGAVGLSWVSDDGFIGASFMGLDSDYGVPGHGHHEEEPPSVEEPGHEEEGVTIGLEQRRFDLEGSRRFLSDRLRGIKGRFGYADYKHTEFEGQEVGTRFTNEQWEGRVEIQHSLLDLMSGAVGIQLGGRDYAALGEEAFVPPANALTYALFAFEELEEGDIRYQIGGRIEGNRVEVKESGLDRSNVGISLSGGVNWTVREGVNLALSGARSVKLPNLEELFSDGPHAATFAYEIGDPDLGKETAYSLDATVRLTEGRVRGELTGFVNLFDQFIYQDFTGEEEDGLPVLRFEQEDAVFRGAEASVTVTLHHDGPHHLLVEGFGDVVRAELRDLDQPLPRIPPFRLGGKIRWDGGTLRADLGMTRVADQTRVSPLEEETEGFSMVDASVGYRLFTGELVHDFVLRGTNLTDQEARSHTSFLKELAPFPGREIRFLYRVYF